MKAGWGLSSTAMCTFIPAAPAPPTRPRAVGDGQIAAVQKQWGRGVGAVQHRGRSGATKRSHGHSPFVHQDRMEWLKIKQIYIYIFLYIQIYNIYISMPTRYIYICHLSEKDKR